MVKSDVKKKRKEPISEAAVYRIMIGVTFAVAAIFLIKDLLVKDLDGAKIICLMLGGLLVMLLALRFLHVKQDVRSFLVSIALVVVVFVISLNSGEYYSDDYALYLAAFALSGHFLNPRITVVQIVLADVLLCSIDDLYSDHITGEEACPWPEDVDKSTVGTGELPV